MLWWALRQLKASDAETRKRAAKKLGKSGNTKAIEPLINTLYDSDAKVRAGAIDALGRIGDVRAIGPLLAALRDSNNDVRCRAAESLEALGKTGDLRAIEPLMTVLKDADLFVRRGAGKAIQALGYMPPDQSQQAMMLIALGKWGDAEALGSAAIEPLVVALRDWDERSKAAEVLGKIGDGRAVEPLIFALKDTDWRVRNAAAQALREIGSSAVESLIAALKDSDEYARNRAVEILGEIGDARAVEPLISALKEADSDFHKRVAIALTRLGDVAVEPLIIALNDLDPGMRLRAAEVLGNIGDTRSIEPLINTLKDAEDVRRAAANALNAMRYKPTDETQQAMMLIACHKWDAAVAFGAAAVEPFIFALTYADRYGRYKGAEVFVRYRAAEALGYLGRLGYDRAVEALIAALKDADEHVRNRAARSLGVIGNARAVEPLIAALDVGSLRVQAAEALEGLGSVAVEPLIRALKDADKHVRQIAVVTLGKIGDARAIEPLIAASKNADENMHRSVEEALKKLNSSNIQD